MHLFMIKGNPFHSGYLQTGTLANREDPDEKPHNNNKHGIVDYVFKRQKVGRYESLSLLENS